MRTLATISLTGNWNPKMLMGGNTGEVVQNTVSRRLVLYWMILVTTSVDTNYGFTTLGFCGFHKLQYLARTVAVWEFAGFLRAF